MSDAENNKAVNLGLVSVELLTLIAITEQIVTQLDSLRPRMDKVDMDNEYYAIRDAFNAAQATVEDVVEGVAEEWEELPEADGPLPGTEYNFHAVFEDTGASDVDFESEFGVDVEFTAENLGLDIETEDSYVVIGVNDKGLLNVPNIDEFFVDDEPADEKGTGKDSPGTD